VLVRWHGSGDEKARRAEVLVLRRGSGDALGRARTAGRGVFGQRRSGSGRRALSAAAARRAGQLSGGHDAVEAAVGMRDAVEAACGG
jgi:hypothetical protein